MEFVAYDFDSEIEDAPKVAALADSGAHQLSYLELSLVSKSRFVCLAAMRSNLNLAYCYFHKFEAYNKSLRAVGVTAQFFDLY